MIAENILNKVSVRMKKIEVRNYTVCYISMNLNHTETQSGIMDEYEQLYSLLMREHIEPVYEKVFGQLSERQNLIEVRKKLQEKYHINDSPFSFVDGTPVTGTPISSITIHGLIRQDETVKIEYLKTDKKGPVNGTCIQTQERSRLYLFGLTGIYKSTLTEDLKIFYQNIYSLGCRGFSSSDLVRTWIYLDNINYSYPVFNEMRNQFFSEVGIGYESDSNNLPASTCVEGIGNRNSLIYMDMIYEDKSRDNVEIRRIYNDLQNEAEGATYLHKPSFSRATALETRDLLEIQISGTASIGKDGATLYVDQPELQIRKTLINFLNILHQNQLSIEDTVQTNCFFKAPEYYQVFKKVCEEMGLKEFSDTFVISNICRDDLLFEIDGIAIKGGWTK